MADNHESGGLMPPLAIRNYERFQHYRDRRPPWVKFYVDFLDDPDLIQFTPTTRLVAALLTLIASMKDNRLPDSASWLAAECNVSVREARRALADLQAIRYLIPASELASGSASTDASETASGSATELLAPPLASRADPRARGEREAEAEAEAETQGRSRQGLILSSSNGSRGSSVSPTPTKTKTTKPETRRAIERLAAACKGTDPSTVSTIVSLYGSKLPPAAFENAREATLERPDPHISYAMGTLRSMLNEGQYA